MHSPPRRRPCGRALPAALAGFVALGAPGAGAVVGGREAPDAPEARAALMVLTAAGGVCTGLVVARDAVLTAGHCVAGVARHRLHYRDAAGAPVFLDVTERAVHPGYDPDPVGGRTRSIDLALLRARAPLPARFEAARLSAVLPEAGALLRLSGYGANRDGAPRSAGRFRSVRMPAAPPHGPSRLLVWLGAPQAGGCHGDSGAPISDGAGVLAVAAWVRDACGGLTQGVLLGPQRAWIDRTLGAWGAAARWEEP